MKQNRHLYIGSQLTFYNVAKTIQRRKELLLTNNAVTIGYLKKKPSHHIQILIQLLGLKWRTNINVKPKTKKTKKQKTSRRKHGRKILLTLN